MKHGSCRGTGLVSQAALVLSTSRSLSLIALAAARMSALALGCAPTPLPLTKFSALSHRLVVIGIWLRSIEGLAAPKSSAGSADGPEAWCRGGSLARSAANFHIGRGSAVGVRRLPRWKRSR